jgi:hypothetical protein
VLGVSVMITFLSLMTAIFWVRQGGREGREDFIGKLGRPRAWSALASCARTPRLTLTLGDFI